MITDLGDKKLTTDNEDYWIAPDANVIGSVHLSKDASVWFNCTLRGVRALMSKMAASFTQILVLSAPLVNL